MTTSGGRRRILALMGSGETAPTMLKAHRQLFDLAGPGTAVMLDTPYGFQTNAPDISRRAQEYFAQSVGRAIDVCSWRRDTGPGLDRERALAAIRDADWVFAGPGSPTYAIRQWRPAGLGEVLRAKLAAGGVVVFASAAALTLSAYTLPVYEVYKAGEDPRWEPGLDVFAAATGLPAVLIPHFDNREGGHHDTRYCYLGEERLSRLERDLPAEVFVLGVDEHTACVLDLDARTVSVLGNGQVTVRQRGRSTVFGTGEVVGFDDLVRAAGSGIPVAKPLPDDILPAPATASPSPDADQPSLRRTADECHGCFTAALAAADVDGAVSATLDLEQALQDWMADTDVSDDRDHARGLLREMIVRLGGLAESGIADPHDRVAPYVGALLAVRTTVRDRKDFALSDLIRDQLTALNIEVHDTPTGVAWTLTDR
jgi:hypothetical protein